MGPTSWPLALKILTLTVVIGVDAVVDFIGSGSALEVEATGDFMAAPVAVEVEVFCRWQPVSANMLHAANPPKPIKPASHARRSATRRLICRSSVDASRCCIKRG